MLIQSLSDLFTRDLNKLILEIEAFKTESAMWLVDQNISNSAGNLSLHIIGNLKTYIGNGLLKTDYVRDREFEFAGKGLSREDIIAEIKETIDIVNKGLSNIDKNDLEGAFPMLIWKEETGLVFTLIHLHSHLNYHLGQVNYHRRLLDKKG